MFRLSPGIAARIIVLVVLGLVGLTAWTPQMAEGRALQAAASTPPFSGTIFLDADIIKPSDPTTLASITYTGQGSRTMFDRRVNGWITVNAYLFNAIFNDGLSAEIQVNPEFGSSGAAQTQAQKYGEVIGRLPKVLRMDVQTVWIHQGTQPFGGGNNNLLIHTGQAASYEADGILEETLVHEAAHTSLDADHALAPNWLAAQAVDGNFISTYARDYPNQEDIAESFLTYLALRYRPGRITQQLEDTIQQTIPHRITYFDAQAFNMSPIFVDARLVARNDSALTLLNTPVTINAFGNDGDPNGDAMTLTALGTPAHGTVNHVNGKLLYTPALNFLGTDTFTYTVSTGSESATATITVHVVSVIHAVYLPSVRR